jgi:superfamily II DNA or RNA helicase
LETGQIVRVRSRQYLVERVDAPATPGECTAVSLSCLDDDRQGEALQVLWELEPDAKVLGAASWEAVKTRGLDPPWRFAAYLHAWWWNCVTSTDPRLFQSPHRAGIKVEPYQLEPLRKALRMPRVNLFIADDVGLGKTIEAGLILRELILRQRVHRVVVAAPPSVVLQWQEELAARFGLGFVVFDRAYVQQRRRERGWAHNPWSSHARFIISHALLRDPDYAEPLRQWLDDGARGALLILDEAHNVAPASAARYAIDSRLTRVVRELAPLFEHRLFLSATPHNGHSNSFAALLELLDPQRFCRGVPVRSAKLLDDVMVRRLKGDLREAGEGDFPRREVIQVDLDGLSDDAPELSLPRLLDRYRALREDAVRDAPKAEQAAAALVVIGLQKRLLSSIEAFARTLKVHRATVLRRRAREDAPTAPARQTSLRLVTEAPGADDDEVTDEELRAAEDDAVAEATEAMGATGAALRGREDELLDAMGALAEGHRHRPDPRVERLVAWVREHLFTDGRWNDRRVLVFTEYADTKAYLLRCLREAFADTDGGDARIEALHGAMGDDEREAVKRAFNADPARHPLRILVATDAAREGVNLQNHCADLFHFDVPWNPSRMEQRNGRIDRKLQRAKTVRCHYFVHAQRPEDAVLAALVAKTETIRRELGSLSDVLERKLVGALQGGIDRRKAAAQAADLRQLPLYDDGPALTDEDDAAGEASSRTVRDELEGTRARAAALVAQVGELAKLRDEARARLKITPSRLRLALSAALEMLGAPRLEALDGAERDDDHSLLPARYRFPDLDARDPSWADALDTLRPPRPRDRTVRAWRAEAPLRPVAFRDAGTLDGAVVHLHLEHPVVRRLLGRFLAQGFVHDDLARACVLAGDDAVKRVILAGRLSLYGPGAARLHDEVVYVSARWTGPVDMRDAPLTPYAEGTHRETVAKLDDALLHPDAGRITDAQRDAITRSVATDVAELLPALERRALSVAEVARTALERRADAEARQMEALLVAQRDRITRMIERYRERTDTAQLALAFPEGLGAEERRQFEADHQHWRRRLAALDAELRDEPARIREGYAVAATRVEPVGAIYLVPAGG